MGDSLEIKMGNLVQQWGGASVKTITFCVTEDCNLACRYCYMTGKNNKGKMSFQIAKQAIDYILKERSLFNEKGVIWDFIGGEPFLEIELIDQISDYIKQQMFLLDHPWFNKYRFSFSTNGILYNTSKVQNYIKKNRGHISIGISIDGNKTKHDLQRIKKDGTGTYDDVIKNISLWLEQFPNAQTKATFSHEDLPFLKESIISIWQLGIKNVAANIVYEDVWKDNDDVIFERQLMDLADYIIENELWDKYSVRFFDYHIGFPLLIEDLERNYCGSGRMLAIDHNGNFFPCIRFLDFSLNSRRGRTIGNIFDGINEDKLRPFYALNLKDQSDDRCIKCGVATGCGWCTGFNYDYADTDTIFQRVTNICKMHQANVRANKYFWNKFSRVTGMDSPRKTYSIQRMEMGSKGQRYLLFIEEIVMSEKLLKSGLNFAIDKGYRPIILNNQNKIESTLNNICINIFDNNLYASIREDQETNTILVYKNSSNINKVFANSNNILLVNKDDICKIFSNINILHKSYSRINIIIQDLQKWNYDDVENYKTQLENLIPIVMKTYEAGKPIEINVLTDLIYLDAIEDCGAGETTFTLAPNGNIYICPAFYFDDPNSYIGDLECGITVKNYKLLSLKNTITCNQCSNYNCKRCKYLNKKLTNEINISSKIQCLVSSAESEVSKNLQGLLCSKNLLHTVDKTLSKEYKDPFERFLDKRGR